MAIHLKLHHPATNPSGRSAISAAACGACRCAAMLWAFWAVVAACVPAIPNALGQQPQINPYPRTGLDDEVVATWDFTHDAEGWTAEHACELSAVAGSLRIHATDEDPYFHRSVRLTGGDVMLVLRARGRTGSSGSVFWTTDKAPLRGEDKAAHFSLHDDGRWHTYRAPFSAPGTILDLRIDPGTGAGDLEIDQIRLVRRHWHPLEIERVDATPGAVRFTLRNHSDRPQQCTALGAERTVAPQTAIVLQQPLPGKRPLEAAACEIVPRDPKLLPLRRTVFTYRDDLPEDGPKLPLGDAQLEIASDGASARVVRDGRMLAALAPIVHCGGRVPAMRLVSRGDKVPTEGNKVPVEGNKVRFEGDGVAVEIAVCERQIELSIRSTRECEGPVVRAWGPLQGGLLAGVEYLGKGESSSSRLDVENAQHLRFEPDPLKLTMPLACFATDRTTVAMLWHDTSLRPTYATPDFFDGTPNHRMSLRGPKDGTIRATLLVDRVPIEETILWAVKKRGGLPPLPPAPRTPTQQRAICLKALENPPLRNDQGWGHCADPGWGHAWHADMVSTIWRLSGKLLDTPPGRTMVAGGAHVPNHTVHFLTGRSEPWLAAQKRHAANLIAAQQPDGSYRYDGPLGRGHFENTANGICAGPATWILEYARLSGDKNALQAGVRTLEYMKRFDVPRGAQTWEVPLHTPDQLASAYLVWAYVRGYELTGRKDFLEQARRWALSGVPFTYLWTRYPTMLYATPPVLGATNWQAPVWIGFPVQWVGGVYAYALTTLAPHDTSLDWNHMARGILISGEQQQYPDGPWQGLLPDSFSLDTQSRNPARINPCAWVSLRMALDGEVDSLAVAADAQHRVIAPFPVSIRDGKARIRARAGLKYQILVDGKAVDVRSEGDDVIPLP